ncbi:RNA-guided endonuclease InsQ/TnpB family protein [Deinococcus cellulosilyticus]|uniref:Transposase n=1 Tax=Deinococcus cellulosilyticus (strain DSM 18568 / NBRC 106333 / KACC 11606 / 5516J-15) TaxID=1223518 RepID=A0A511NAG7_DEIC1|nr:transposase [Deinococcus cellulosilyticus]GEM49361.1 transposase [Deinococcus cellulosilyticus NBRC 106333 = KACC 11606]
MVLEYKLVAAEEQRRRMDKAIRTAQFVRNHCLRYWMDGENVGKNDIYKHTTKLRAEFEWAKKLNSTAVQAAGERAWSAISRFYDNHKRGIKPVGYPKFKKNVRSVEYKQSGWKLDAHNKRLTLTDGFKIGVMKLLGKWDLMLYRQEDIKRLRIVKRADGYYAQFLVDAQRHFDLEPSGKTIGLDVGLKSFYTDSRGYEEPNPRFYRKAERALKKLQRRISRKVKGSKNRQKAVMKLGRKHLKIQRQRKDHAVKLARCVVMSHDVVAFEDLKVRNMIKNRKLSKSIQDAGWREFRRWIESFAKIMGKIAIPVNPAYTSQMCSRCGVRVKKDLKTRMHMCGCGVVLDRDHNAAINILKVGLRMVGHTRTAGVIQETLVEMEEDLNSGASVDEARIPPL